MLPEPLHPAIVHLPIALAILLPLLTLCGAVAIRADWLPRRAWSVAIALAGVLLLSSWAALETGESEEDRVERVVAEERIEAHEEAAEVFVAIGLVFFVVTAVGILSGQIGGVARGASVLIALALLLSGVRVGHLGGELVYEHGAASAYAASVGAGPHNVGDHAARNYGDDDDDD